MNRAIVLLSVIALLAGCAGTSSPQGTGLHQSAKRQQSNAEHLEREYVHCIEDIDHKTAREAFANAATRREVVLESCRDIATRFIVVREQAYSDECMATGGDSKLCDNQAVSKARQDSDTMQQKAGQHIDETSAASRHTLP